MIPAHFAGCDHPAPIYSGLHGYTGNKEAVTSPAELSPQIARNADPFLHRYPAGQPDTPVTPLRVFRKETPRLCEENTDSL